MRVVRRTRFHAPWRDVLFDVAPAGVLLALGMWDLFGQLTVPYGGGARWTAAGPITIACFALLVRRRWPMFTLSVVLAVLVLPGFLMPTRLTYWGEYVVWLVAMYSVGRHALWPRGIWAIPASLGAYTVAIIHYPAMREPDTILFNIAVLLGLWSVGRLAASWVWSRERNLQLEIERVQAEERAAARERTRIARELHDLISHTITVIVMQAGGARLAGQSDPSAATEALARIESLGRDSLGELRTMLAVLRVDDDLAEGKAPQPTFADVPGLCQRLEHIGLPVRLRMSGELTELSPGVQLAGYRIVQEGLTNVLKHAGMVQTDVIIDRGAASEVVLGIASAVGTDRGNVPGAAQGLRGLRERVDAVGGTLTAHHGVDGRFVLQARLPVPSEAG